MKRNYLTLGILGLLLLAANIIFVLPKESDASMLNCATAPNIHVPVMECVGLVELFNNMAGAGWANSSGWNTNTNVCDWYGITCTNIGGSDHVTAVSLGSNNLIGTILPPSMSGLRYIDDLNLNNNGIHAMLPSQWSTWTGIYGFHMGNNTITGTLPSSWSTWQNLHVFQMPMNLLTGALPSSWSGMTNLTFLDLNNNTLGGNLPSSWSTMTNMSYVAIFDNDFTGSLPASWGAWSNLSTFYAYRNNISGNLPASWSGMVNMYSFSIYQNQLTGTLPTSLSTWTNIHDVELGSNQFTGGIPSTWSTWTNIVSFGASANSLYQPLPASLSSWSNVTLFNVAGNYIHGPIPTSWDGGMISLIDTGGLNIEYNCLDTNLPEPPANFVYLKAGMDWERHQYQCIRSDLTVVKNNSLPTGYIGMTYTYTIDYFNSGSVAVSGVKIIDSVAWGVSYLTGTPVGVITGGQILWDLGTLNPMEGGTITAVFMFDTGAYSSGDTTQNYAYMLGNVWDYDDLNGASMTDPITLLDIPSASSTDLVVVKTNTASTGTIGGLVQYTISYENSGSVSDTSVSIADSLPAGLIYISSSPSATIVTGSDITWNLGTLSAMQTGSISITALADTGSFLSGDTVSNTATINGSLSEIDGSNNSSTTSPLTLFGGEIFSDLTITKSNSNSTGSIGGSFTYTITYTNSGSVSISGVSISDTLITGLSFVSSSPTPTLITGNTLYWDIGTLSAMQTGSISINVTIGTGFSSGATITNTASITGSTITDLNWSNNTATTSPVTLFTPLSMGDLIITKTNSGGTARVGETYRYVIHYINSGDTTITGVIIRDTLMTGLTYPDYSASTPSATIFTGFRDITWDIGTLSPMQSGDIIIDTFVGGPFASGTLISNTATITGFTDFNWGNNSSTTTGIAVMLETGDISIFKESLVTTGMAGDIISYNIYYRSNGPSEDMVIHDILPGSLTYVSSDFSGNPLSVDYTTGIMVTGGNVSWNLWAITPNATGMFTVYAQIGGGTTSGTLIMNTASITGNIEDVNRSNNSSTANSIIVFGAPVTGDLSIFKFTPNAVSLPGDIITFLITYVNSGEQNETGIMIQDYMQTGLTYITSNFTSGLTITANPSNTLLSWYITGNFAPHTLRNIIIQAKVEDFVTSSGTVLTNTVSITGERTDVDASFDSGLAFTTVIGSGGGITGMSTTTGGTTGTTTSGNTGGGGGGGRGFGGGGGYDFTPPPDSLGSAPDLEAALCNYNDGNFQLYKKTFKDIQNSPYKSAVDLMLDFCLVQGQHDKGKVFDIYSQLRWGEAYKMFSRLAGLKFDIKPHPAHWSDPYRFAGQKIHLWDRVTSTPHSPKAYITYADIFTIGNNILKYYGKAPLEYNPETDYNATMSRGRFALFVQNIITKIRTK